MCGPCECVCSRDASDADQCREERPAKRANEPRGDSRWSYPSLEADGPIEGLRFQSDVRQRVAAMRGIRGRKRHDMLESRL